MSPPCLLWSVQSLSPENLSSPWGLALKRGALDGFAKSTVLAMAASHLCPTYFGLVDKEGLSPRSPGQSEGVLAPSSVLRGRPQSALGRQVTVFPSGQGERHGSCECGHCPLSLTSAASLPLRACTANPAFLPCWHRSVTCPRSANSAEGQGASHPHPSPTSAAPRTARGVLLSWLLHTFSHSPKSRCLFCFLKK